MKARYIQEVGTRGRLRIYWDRETLIKSTPDPDYPGHFTTRSRADNSCPNCCGGGKPGYHNALKFLRDVSEKEAWRAFGKVEDYATELWPSHCSDCGAPVPPNGPKLTVVGQSGFTVTHQVFTKRLYNTASGDPEPGDLYESDWHEEGECPYWDNCPGVHLWAILPNGDHWDVMSRASNCTMRDDKTHRCWVIQGSYKDGTITVDKNGHTCAAGAGSIAVDGWHGFLRNGEFTT